MNSIHQQQSEDPRKNLTGREAVERIEQMVAKAQTCFFCTHRGTGESHGVRPMNVRKVDAEGNLWFLSADDSHKNLELQAEPLVRLFFQGSPHSDFLHLEGRATISRDRTMIKDLWEPMIKNWFTGGIDDPRITVIKVTPTDGYYWDTKHATAIAGIKLMLGAITGNTMDDSIEGKLHV